MKKMSEMEKWLKVVKETPVAFGLEAGFSDLRELHNEWIRLFMYTNEDLTLQAHRGSYKTTCLSIAIALMIILQPKKKIIFLRKADDDVKEIVQQVAKMLVTDFFQQLAYVMYGRTLVLTKESAFEVDTNLNPTASGSSQLLGIGTGGSLTGKHADIVITDDIVNLNDRSSRAHREQTKLIYQELQNIKNDGGRILNTGTPWHPDDAFTLMKDGVKSYMYDVYSTGMFDDEEIENRRSKMDPSLFAANYELRHISSDSLLFTNPVIDDGTRTDRIHDGVAHIDAAYGGDDYSAFTIMNKHADGKIYVFGKLKQEHIDDVLLEFEQDRARYRAGVLYNESNADKGFLAKKIIKPVKLYHESMNKHVKISTYIKEHWDDIVFIKGTDKKYIDQIIDYVEGSDHDDAPDSLASLLREHFDRVQFSSYSGL